MSQENVELVRRIYEEFWKANALMASPDEIERAFREYFDEQFEVRLPPDYPEGEPVFRGREGLAQLLAMLGDTWGEWQMEPERFLDGGDRVVMFGRILAEGGASRVPIEFETTHVWTVRTGRATSLHAFRDRSQALEAAGLQE
jgi:ketosteroid isomerase-like protein